MPETTAPEPKQRILNAAVSLFAQKGFAAVGVREVAREAGVNIAMISYYFEGKVGILRAILEEFFDRYQHVLSQIDFEAATVEDRVSVMIRNLVDFARENTELAIVAYNELPLDIPELAELKAEKIRALIRIMSGLIKRFGLDPGDTRLLGMVGPGLISMIFMNFRIKPILMNVFEVKFDDAYYSAFAETIATLFLSGIRGVAARRELQGRITT